MSFTDQKPRIATEEDCVADWGGEPKAKRFRCYLCGLRFVPGDTWRWVYGACRTFVDKSGETRGVLNFITCAPCDGPDVLDRWVAANEGAVRRFWWMS